MKIKTASIILIIASGLNLLFLAFSSHFSSVNYSYYNLPQIMIPISLLMFGISLLNKNKLESSGIILTVVSGLILISTFIRFGMFSDQLFIALFSLFIPISLLVLGISLIRNIKLKISGIILIVASVLFLLSTLFTFRIFQYDLLNIFIDLLIPFALLLTGISLIKNDPNNVLISDSENLLKEQNYPNLSTGDWLVIFLITIIPLVGLIFMCIWANDESKKVRKNYAVATLIWWGIILFLYILLFSNTLSGLFRNIF